MSKKKKIVLILGRYKNDLKFTPVGDNQVERSYSYTTDVVTFKKKVR